MDFSVPSQMSLLSAARLAFPDSSGRTLRQWIKGGRFSLERRFIKNSDRILEAGQTIQIADRAIAKRASGVKILFEDRDCIVIDKPVGLLSVPLDGPASPRHALGLLREYYQTDQIFAVHRIDRETSGVLLFARGYPSMKKFDSLFEKHDLVREYFAILEGRLPENKGTWDCYLSERDNLDVGVVHDPKDGKQAITHFEVVHRSAKYTYVRLTLETGRKHQIRVHCQRAGCPVLGDRRYGSQENPIGRLCLHARVLSFVHPFNRQEVQFLSPLPSSFNKLTGRPQLKLDPQAR